MQEARALLAAHTPAEVRHARNEEMRVLFGSPTPLRLSAEFLAASEPPTSESVRSLVLRCLLLLTCGA